MICEIVHQPKDLNSVFHSSTANWNGLKKAHQKPQNSGNFVYFSINLQTNAMVRFNVVRGLQNDKITVVRRTSILFRKCQKFNVECIFSKFRFQLPNFPTIQFIQELSNAKDHKQHLFLFLHFVVCSHSSHKK